MRHNKVILQAEQLRDVFYFNSERLTLTVARIRAKAMLCGQLLKEV